MATAPAAAAKAAPKATAAPKLPVWVWEGKTKSGEVKKGEVEAADEASVQQRLRAMALTNVKIKKKPIQISLKLPGFGGIGQKDLVIFTRQFATMIDAGLPLVQCLDILSGQLDNMAFREVLTKVKLKVESGSTLADALGDHPKVFDTLYVQLVAAGEIGGILDTILNRLAQYIEKNEKLKARVKGAMVYPSVVLVVAVGVTVVLLLFVTPTFEKMFKDFGGAMPAPTQIVIDLSKWLQHYIGYLVAFIIAAVIGFRAWVAWPKGRVQWDSFVIRTPIFGPLVRKVAVARFTRTLGTVISSGVPILDALEVVAKTAGNAVVEKAIRYTKEKIAEGKTIVQPLGETKVFPTMVVQMIGVGEATGAMDQMLTKIADFYDDEVDAAVAALTSLIEPVMMVFLGGVVGGFLIAMYLPIFSIAGAVGRTMTEAGVYSPLAGERPEGGLYSKLVLLTGVRLSVGTALLAATAWPTLGHDPFPRSVEALLFAIVALIYFASLVGTFLLRTRSHLGWVAHGQIAADVIAATGLVYLTGGADSIFTILYPLAIVSAAIGLGRRGAALAAGTSCLAFCILAAAMQSGAIGAPASELERAPLPPGRLAVVMAANLSAFMLVGGLSSLLAEQLQGARRQLLRSETRLEALEAIYSAVVRSIASGILTLGEDGHITYLNPAAEHLTGLSDRSSRGQPLGSLLPELAASIVRPRERGRPEVRLRAHDGRDRILGYATAPLAGGASGQVILFQDLTELRQMEEAVRRTDRLAVVGGLAAGLAHEIRNPLASMCGSIEILGAAPGLDEQERRLMQVVRSEAERLEALVREFLSFAKPISPAFEPLDGARVVTETVELFRQEVAERGIELVARTVAPVWVRADPGQLRQVLWNLLGNAADATPTGGRVEVGIVRQAGEGVLEVSDTGHGIADEDLQRIFDPFFTTKERGTGLGLAIVHRIVEAHSGHLSVHSEVGRGTTFRVALPIAAAPAQQQPAQAEVG